MTKLEIGKCYKLLDRAGIFLSDEAGVGVCIVSFNEIVLVLDHYVSGDYNFYKMLSNNKIGKFRFGISSIYNSMLQKNELFEELT